MEYLKEEFEENNSIFK